jgi:unsaturated rhamnogalacturonyl hydrolase
MAYSEEKTEMATNYLSTASEACDALMKLYRPEELPPAGKWHYHQGVFLDGMLKVWERTRKQEYFDYAKGYIDHLLDDEGNFVFARDELDSIQVGILLFPLYQQTKEKKYMIAAAKLRNLYHTLNKTSEGGFWHKDKYPYQMWLDGLYMSSPFALLYNKQFNEPELADMVVYQEKLMRRHMKDHKTGLFYHAWDEKKVQPWANADTGCSPEFWGRSMGWYGTALVDILELLPVDHPGRDDIIQSLQSYVEAIIKFQDYKTGLWYQILDKGDQENNWLESSCTSLFIYVIARAVQKGYVNKEFLNIAKKAYNGLLEHMVETKEDRWALKGICIGTSAGVYDYYVTRPSSENDLHGVGAFVLASVALYDAEQK